MSNVKGGLIQKKKNTLQPPKPVKKVETNDFNFSNAVKATEEPKVEETKVTQEVVVVENEPEQKSKLNITVGKSNSTKSIKVPTIIHTEINLLGSFIDESKTYEILQRLIDSYVEHEFTDRQRRQFEFMVDAFNKEK